MLPLSAEVMDNNQVDLMAQMNQTVKMAWDTPKLRTRFESKVSGADANGCENWTRARSTGGYGMFRGPGTERQAHRVAYMLYVGEIPGRMCVLHRCGNKLCVNPSHLFLEVRAENARRALRIRRADRTIRHERCNH